MPSELDDFSNAVLRYLTAGHMRYMDLIIGELFVIKSEYDRFQTESPIYVKINLDNYVRLGTTELFTVSDLDIYPVKLFRP